MTIRSIGLLSIILSTLIAWLLAMAAISGGEELGALFNLVLPPFAGLISLVIFLLVCLITKEKVSRIIAVVICCLYLVYTGLAFQLNPGYLPIPF